ncbi:gamma-glutamylcyclotransferase [Tropicibacter sp. R15_0]|nr:gamma-glutamylcyclotransferase [Tropicibacter sp. R15_0]MBO9466851.1 gamma-glutamylcyclotransferase [Tropicibacter sp. R15_0]
MTDLFLYGTLRYVPLLSLVLGRPFETLNAAEATLPDHAVHWAKDEAFPMIVSKPGAKATGLLLRDLSRDDLDSLNYYEGGFAYDLVRKTVQTETGPCEADVYVPQDDRWALGDLWSLQDWAARWGQMTLRAAQEVMSRRDRFSASDIQSLLPFFRARAWAQELAAEGAPQTVRSQMSARDVTITKERPGFDGFFRLKAFEATHKRFDGGQSNVLQRETFMSFDVTLVLPYDPINDQVLLVEQLRLGTFNRGDPAPWVLEPIAGLVDAGEDPKQAGIREAQEEAGLDLAELITMPKVYASPGYSTEFFHCYLALCDLTGRGQGQGGLAEENEDIRSHVLSFDHAMRLVDSGEVNVAPLAMMLLWLYRQRSTLRAKTGTIS